MKLSKLLLFLVLAITFSHYASHAAEVETNSKENATNLSDDEVSNHLAPIEDEDSPMGLARRLLFPFQSLQKGLLTCNKYPRVCRRKGSAGPDCCKKKCVNVERDRNNCGRCGKKYKYSKICCKGKCVNPLFNRKHCGGCNIECSKGSFCVYGICGEKLLYLIHNRQRLQKLEKQETGRRLSIERNSEMVIREILFDCHFYNYLTMKNVDPQPVSLDSVTLVLGFIIPY
ncbi:hypothetical protein IC582_029552 [Cucumis melo]